MAFSIPKTALLGTYRYTARARYYDIDAMGRVHHATYFRYLEDARTEWLRLFKLTYKEIEAGGVFMPVVDVQARYRQPLVYDEVFHVDILIFEKPTTRLPIYYRVTNEKDKLICEAKTELCFLDVAKNRPVFAPPVFIEFVEKATQVRITKH